MAKDVTNLAVLAWKQAGLESACAGDNRIRPAHLLMGLTKAVEHDFQGAEIDSRDLASTQEEQAEASSAFKAGNVSTTQLRRFFRSQLQTPSAGKKTLRVMHRDREVKNTFLAAKQRCRDTPCSCTALLWALATGSNRELTRIADLGKIDLVSVAAAAAQFLPSLDPLDERFDVALARITYPEGFPTGEQPWDLWQQRAIARGIADQTALSVGARIIRECISKGWNDLLWSELDLENRGDGMIFSLKHTPDRCVLRWASLLESSGERSALPRQCI